MPTEVAKPETLKLTFEGQVPSTSAFDVFAFSANGKLLARTTAKAGAAELEKIDPTSHVFVAPAGVVAANEVPTMSKLRAANVYEPVLTVKEGQATALPVAEAIWRKWMACCTCRVRGRVVAAPGNLPVPFARVHVVEIDIVRFIDLMPRADLFRLRDDLLVSHVFPPPPPPPPDVRGKLSKPVNAPGVANALASTVAIAPLTTDSEALVRSTMRAHYQELLPALSKIEWFWRNLYLQQELAVVETNVNGRFDAYVNGCTRDVPDLYFWVETWIDGRWTTVYHPPIRNHTYWNYQCDHLVTITIDDNRVVPVCPAPTVLKGVEILRLGNYYIPSIDQSTGLTADGRPFGGTICPVVSFADMQGVATHYRWQYQKANETEWHDLTQNVYRHYRERGMTPTGLEDQIKPYPLGPHGTMHLYEIPPIHPPQRLGFDSFWVMYANPGDEVSGYFNSNAGGTIDDPIYGPFTLRLQLFKNVSGDGNSATQVALDTANDPFSIPQAGATTDTIPAMTPPGTMLELDGAGKVAAFKMKIFVDNAPCTAQIHRTSIAGTEADTCGILHGGSGKAKISFTAWHPRKYASVSFHLTRGLTGIDNAKLTDVPLSQVNPNGYVHDGTNGAYTDEQDVAGATGLVGPCGSGAAFAETLDVTAMATDGYTRLWYLDAHTAGAFAIIPK